MTGLTEGNLEGFDADRWVPFLGWASGELSKCLANISEACDAAMEGRPLPPPLYGPGGSERAQPATAPVTQGRGRGRPKAVRDPNKPKRKPSAFNQFVKERIEALKAEGFTADPAEEEGVGNALFKKAIDEWRLLSDAERSQYTQQYKEQLKEDSDALATAAAATATAAADDEEVDGEEIDDQSPATPEPEPSPVAAEAAAPVASPVTEKKKRKKDKGESHGDKSEQKKKHKKKSKPANVEQD